MGIDERLRQQKVSNRRKESGFNTKKCHFFKRDLKRLDQLAKTMGYDTTKSLSNEDYTSIIRSCIAEKYKKMFPNKTTQVPDTKEEQYLYELKQIVSYRLENNSSITDIAEFMEKSGYPVPKIKSKTQTSEQTVGHQKWDKTLVDTLKPKKK